MRASIVDHVIDSSRLVDEVAQAANGATAIFLGTVRSRNDDREVTGIEYSAYREMAESEMRSILEEARAQYGIEEAAIEHRIGSLTVGEVSIAAVVSSPHRAEAMDALRFIVDETKRRAPIWKLEHYTDGEREWVGASTAGPR